MAEAKQSPEVKNSTSGKAAKAKTTKKGADDGDNQKDNSAANKTANRRVKEEVVETQKEAVETPEQAVAAKEEVTSEEPKTTAKAGKRSAKALKEAEAKRAKEERKTSAEQSAESRAQRKTVKPARSKLERRGKKFREAAKQIDQSKEYSLKDALELAVKTSPVKFDASVELHMNLGVDPRQAEQNIRGNIVLPAGTGKAVRVAVFAEGDKAAAAKAADADIIGSDDFLKQLDKELINFDVLIATPQLMARLGKYARLLGPKGLMPNPKSGTVTSDVAKAVTEAKAGRVEYRVDSTGIVHLAIGKVSFGADKLNQNAEAVMTSVRAAKPGSLKGTYIRKVHVTTTMGPSVRVATAAV